MESSSSSRVACMKGSRSDGGRLDEILRGSDGFQRAIRRCRPLRHLPSLGTHHVVVHKRPSTTPRVVGGHAATERILIHRQKVAGDELRPPSTLRSVPLEGVKVTLKQAQGEKLAPRPCGLKKHSRVLKPAIKLSRSREHDHLME